MTEKEIQNISKEKFRKIVKIKVQNASFKYLKELKNNHSKMRNLNYDEFKLAEYLSSPLFNDESRKLLLALRTRTVPGIRTDYGTLYVDKMCPLGCGDEDNIPNILSCRILREKHKSDEMLVNSELKYSDIFSNNIRKQKEATELFRQLLETRNQIISSVPVANTGPVHGQQTLQKLSVLSHA